MSFLHATDLGSSDSDDDDYVPDEKEVQGLSEEEDVGLNDEEDEGQKGKKKNKKKKTNQPEEKKRGQLFADHEEEEKVKEEFKKDEQEMKEKEEKKKLDDLWADFKRDVPTKPKAKPVGSGLGSLTNMVKVSQTTNTAKAVSNTNNTTKPKPRSIVSSIFDSIDTTLTKKPKEEVEEKTEEKNEENGKVKITKVFDFAGENIEITETVDKDSKEAKKFEKSQETAGGLKRPAGAAASGLAAAPGGLSNVMKAISGKKAKMGCLDKSKLDWNSFVEKEGIKEELETFNKGKDGYVEKQEFLTRADLRRFEIEKEAREKTRKTLNR